MNQQIIEKLNKHYEKCEIKKFAKGKILTLANQEPDGVYLLVSGLVEQYDITPEGNKITVNVFRPPAFFPMSWAINKTPNNYFFAALTEVELKQASTNDTVSFLKSNPDVMFDLLSRVYLGTDAILRRLVLASTGIASSRLIYEILIETYRSGVEIDDKTRFVTLKQSSLAARSGLARETVSREMHKLELEKLIFKDKKGFTININDLEQKLDFESRI